MSDVMMDETDDLPRALSAPQSLAVGIARAEIDQQITTARAYPRSLKQVSDRVFSLATLDRESAEESMYALPRGGKPITGPSIRFAEIVKQAYGNCRAAARVVHVDREEKYVEAEGVFHDLETNVATTARVRRRIVDSKGKLYSDDMIIVTGNAACSIALRNAIMGGVPKPLWRNAYEAVQGTIKGDITTLSENRTKALQAFAVYGVKPEQVFTALDVRGAEDITVEHIPLLRSMFATLKNGEATVEEMFGSLTAPGTPAQALHAGFEDQKPNPTTAEAQANVAGKRRARAAAAAPKDVLDGDDVPKEGGVRPTDGAEATGTDGAQAAGAEPATSETATPASEDGAEASSGQQASEQPTSDGAADELPPEPERETTEGEPAADEVYHLADSGWFWDPRRGEYARETYKNGEPFSTAPASKELAVYADHAAEAPGGDQSEAQEEVDEDTADLPPEFAAYAKAIDAAKTFGETKKAMQAFYNSDYFKAMSPAQQNKVRADTWDACTEGNLPDLPDQAADVSAFRLWIEWCEDADAIEGTLAVLEKEPAFAQKDDGFKDAIRKATANRVAILRG